MDFKKPCKKFETLKKMFLKYANKSLADDEIYSASICGKSSRHRYGESGDRHYLCHDTSTCEDIIKFIRKYRLSRDLVQVQTAEWIDCDEEDLRHAEYALTEWYGAKRITLKVIITTPKGVKKSSGLFYV